ncbi:hypothetical protein D9613_012666 [Agrocybe pediades]|uniref:Uncharacterized protein n=1 Tax=Agrocybe pediades TaxID=84607 RepID=A0A8H4VS61_9AGAR|nr:hypothetical protein D9613_012666 [Agrocybe pediades]
MSKVSTSRRRKAVETIATGPKSNILFPTMFSADDLPSSFSVAQQKALISADFNSTLLLQFLFGIYTGVFPAAIYIYIHKKNRTRASDMIIIGSTTALYFATALATVMNWLYTNILLGTHGATRAEMVLENLTQDGPLGEHIIEDLTIFVVYSLADGLLTLDLDQVFTAHRATHSGDSLLIDTKPGFKTIQVVGILDRLTAAAFVAVAATSFVSTGMICLQIWRHTTPRSQSRKRYRTIISALVESSAIYTAVVSFEAVLQFTYTGNIKRSLQVFVISYFVSAVSQMISGLAPSLMIARLFLSSGPEDTEDFSVHLPSDLITCASYATDTDMANAGADLEMQQMGSIGLGEDIRVVAPICHGQPEHEVEDRLNTTA